MWLRISRRGCPSVRPALLKVRSHRMMYTMSSRIWCTPAVLVLFVICASSRTSFVKTRGDKFISIGTKTSAPAAASYILDVKTGWDNASTQTNGLLPGIMRLYRCFPSRHILSHHAPLPPFLCFLPIHLRPFVCKGRLGSKTPCVLTNHDGWARSSGEVPFVYLSIACIVSHFYLYLKQKALTSGGPTRCLTMSLLPKPPLHSEQLRIFIAKYYSLCANHSRCERSLCSLHVTIMTDFLLDALKIALRRI